MGPEMAAACCTIRRLATHKGDQAVLLQLLSLEKKLFKKQDNWGDLLVKETQRRNTFLLYAEAPAAAAAPEPPAASRRQPRKPQQAQPPPQQQRQQEQQAAVVGYIVYTTTGLNAHISKLAVAPDWRRRGVARSLVRAAVGSARAERRVASVSLHVDAENAPALGLYQGEGFASEALLEDYYCRGRHAHKMRLELGSSSL
ncbi:hypothetical protein CHLNCDRAFT_144116 [Chlorella variabilis]|uniref:N-acetyltransferase domain-containing protein n=1 Tax=Chlorella variabilis TaxID=554065 RepID=E1ZBY1_CHLVA|nr:hypothetical protein CHLNCDRAFT_144116 [Chlorella variabilis]EFN56512.1 hypothetical protein CHLNCDRAFT_144116 [Chlorella variabilis]|eukprot:XP_005848614.1 hypothetical protein CHLNCDRAFT_144116 [Chlorella variabilis]